MIGTKLCKKLVLQ